MLVDFCAVEGFESAEDVDAVGVFEAAEFVGSEEFSFLFAVLDAPAAVYSFGFAGCDGIDGLVAECFAEVFGGGLVVASEEEFAVAVGEDGFPVIFVHAFDLSKGL